MTSSPGRVRLNLGCGQSKLPGYVNVDKFGDPDVKHDLEHLPWPFADDSVEEIRMTHVLEHLGRDPDVFLDIFKELYRVSAPGCRIYIVVPHPRHEDFLGDPTHVRAITPGTLELFSRKKCFEWAKTKAANTPLALYLDVDFEITENVVVIDQPYWGQLQRGEISDADLQTLLRERNNVAKEWQMTLQVVKPPRQPT